MPKYSVSDVLDIIRDLSTEEKQELQHALPSVLSATTATVETPSSPAQQQRMEGINISGSSGIELNQIEADRGSRVGQSKTRAAIQGGDLDAALGLLERLKQDIATSDGLNSLEKQIAEISRQALAAELNKPQPNKSTVEQAVEALQKGLAGVEVLATPVTRVVELIAKAWVGL